MLSEIRYRTIQNTHKGIYSYIGLICKTINKEFEICLRILSLLLIVEFFSIEMLKWFISFVLVRYIFDILLFFVGRICSGAYGGVRSSRPPPMAHTH